MLSAIAIPVLLSILGALLVGLVTWGFWQVQRSDVSKASMDTGDHLPLGLLLRAIFSVGMFLTYVLLSTGL